MAPSDTMARIAAESNEAHDVPDPSAGGVAASTTRAENKHLSNVSRPPEAGVFAAGSGVAAASSRSDLGGAIDQQDVQVGSDEFFHEQSRHHVMRYSPYPPFAPLSATTTGSAASSSSSSVSTSTHGKTPTATGYGRETPSFCSASTASSTITRYTGSATSLPSRFSKTITPLVGGGTKTYVIDHLGRLTTAGSAKEITPDVDAASPEPETLSNETCSENDHDDDDNDDDIDDNVSVSSLDVSNHTQAVADALTCAGIATVIVSTGQPKSLFADTASDICSPGSSGGAAASQPPSGRRGLLAKFNEAEEAAEAADVVCCRPSGSPSLSSSSSLSGTPSSATSSSGAEEYTNDTLPSEADGHNLKGDMNEERRADTTKWKRRVGGDKGKKGKGKKKRRRLA